LAKRVGLSKQGAEYKFRGLIEKGVVKGFYPVINVPKLGYQYCRLLLTLQNASREKEREIIDYLKAHEKVFWLFEMQGPFDLLLVIWARSLKEFQDFREEIVTNYGEFIKFSVETLPTDVIHYQHRYLLGGTGTKAVHIAETSERISIDPLDVSILKLLCGNARASVAEMSRKLSESEKVISYRVKKMQEQKLIECYRPIINHSKLGLTYYKVLINLSNVSRKELEKLKKYVVSNPIVVYEVEGIGLPADFELEVMVKSNQELFDFIKDLKFKFPRMIGDYTTAVFVDTLKVRYLPF